MGIDRPRSRILLWFAAIRCEATPCEVALPSFPLPNTTVGSRIDPPALRATKGFTAGRRPAAATQSVLAERLTTARAPIASRE